MTLLPTHPRNRMAPDSAPFVCPDCTGPSATWKGDVHRWRCSACCDVAVGLNATSRYTTTTTTTEKVTT